MTLGAPGIKATITERNGMFRVFAVEDRFGPLIPEPSPFKNPERGVYVTEFGIRENALRYVAQAGWELVS